MGILFLVVHRWRPFSVWAIGFLMLLHYCFWLPPLWRIGVAIPFYDLISPRISFVFYVMSGAVWLIYVNTAPQCPAPVEGSRGGGKWLLAVSAPVLVAASGLWLPGK